MNSLTPFFVLIAFLAQYKSLAQTDNAFRTISGDQVLIKNNDITEGDPYLFSDWKLATIIDSNGNALENNQLNYDCIREAFLIKVENKFVKLNQYQYSEVQVATEDGIKDFVNVVYDGNVFFAESLYRSENVALLVKHEAKKNFTNRNNYNDIRSRYTIAKKTKYFVRIGTEIFPTSKKEKDILAILKNKNLKAFIKKNKLKVKKDEDLIELMQYFDTLQ